MPYIIFFFKTYLNRTRILSIWSFNEAQVYVNGFDSADVKKQFVLELREIALSVRG